MKNNSSSSFRDASAPKNQKKDIIILPKVNYNIKYNINNTPNINTKKNDYDAVRDIVENNEDKNINKVDKNFITKNINKFQIV